jgi:hypothetical protein
LKWAEVGVRERSLIQRIAQNSKLPNPNYWVETGDLGGQPCRKPPEDTPEVHIAKEQIRKDGRLIVENVTRAIEKWRDQHKTSKQAEPT